MIRKKILFICPFPEGVQAGQRLKYEQHFELFKKKGFDITVAPFIDIKTYKIIYKSGYIFSKFKALVKGYYRRFKLINNINNFDLVYIFMWATPFFGATFEKIYVRKSKKTIYDIEDNVLIKKVNYLNRFTYYFKSINKINYLINNVDYIISSAPNLSKKIIDLHNISNIQYIPPSLNLQRYNRIFPLKKDNEINIGWTGTFSSIEFVKIIEPILVKINKVRKIKFIVISNSKYHHNNINYESIIWSKENEIKDLSKFDIGIYPLPMNDEWVIGKSGLKSLQYMAIGIPSISSNVGNISKIVTNMHDGILVNNNDEWFNMLLRLIDDENLRNNISKNAKIKIKNEYSVEVLNKKYINIFNKLIN